MLILKLTDNNRRAHGGFQWPDSGPVTCPDWNPEPVCGGGLHGWGEGSGAYRHGTNEGQWIVFCADTIVPIDGGEKVKAPAGEVVYCGTRVGAVAYLKENGALTSKSDPAWACLTPAQCVEVAMRAADRAVRKYAPKRFRARGMIEAAERLEKLPKIVDRKTAYDAAYAAAYAANANATDAANAAAYAANATDAADANAAANAAAYDAANAAAYDAAYAAYDAAYAAAYAANAAANAANATDAADARAEEREAVRLDKLEMLGIEVTRV